MIMNNFCSYGQYIYNTVENKIHSVELLARPNIQTQPVNLELFFSMVQIQTLERWFQYQLQQAILLYKKTGIRGQVNLDARTLELLDIEKIKTLKNSDAYITIEITQIQGLPDHELVNRLHSYAPDNVSIALDDLDAKNDYQHLSNYTFHEIKLDRSLVKEVETDFQIAKRLLEIKNTFNVELIVEGVENIHQLKMLKDLGFHLFQGFYFSRPKPLKDILEENTGHKEHEDFSSIKYQPAIE